MAIPPSGTRRTPGRFLIALLLPAMAAVACPAAAADKNVLYKCVDPAGVVSIQSESCPSGWTQSWRRDTTPEPVLTPEQEAQAEARRMRNQQTVRELSEVVERKLQAATAPVPAPAPRAARDAADALVEVDDCQAAQDFAASLRQKTWLVLTEDQVRRIYGWVAEQCKVPAPAN